MCEDMQIPFLGRIPLDPRIGSKLNFSKCTLHVRECNVHCVAGKACDEGKSYFDEVPDSAATEAFKHIINSKMLFACISKEIIVA